MTVLYELAPAGNVIALRRPVTADGDLANRFELFDTHFYGSGTAALAAAIAAATRRKSRAEPEVIVPAYACPDVISAVLYAGAKPVLADLDGLRPWMDVVQVEARISPRTAAIVAVNFLGIPERRASLQRLAHGVGALLIEDSAQSLPIERGELDRLVGDLIILSFGRGKPVSLLGGGAVLTRRQELADLLPPPEDVGKQREPEWRFRMRVAAYNCLRRPRLYWLLRALPFLRLGQTIYKPLMTLAPEPDTIRAFLASNLDAYRDAPLPAAGWIREMLADLRMDGITDLVSECAPQSQARLLRYPILIRGAGLRDAVFRALYEAGLGASRLYRRPLLQIPGVAEAAGSGGEFPAAQAFADALLTLPTHAQVRRKDVEATRVIIARVMQKARAAPEATD